ncbi:hypothetical protein B0T10DRAFT_445692, partial [Thelonectria olida]
MEGIGIAANVIAVVDLSANVLSLCFQYSREVKNAKDDIDRLRNEVENLKATSKRFQGLIDGPHGTKLQATQELHFAVKESRSRLEELEHSLRPSTSRKAMSRFGIRALKWPFQSRDIERTIELFARSRDAISLALQVDQTAIILGIDEKAALDRLPFAEDASFDSHAEEHNSTCLPNTRVELLNDISQWISDPSSKTIFWLNGMAGTGKSTISRTTARSRSELGDLGASFFFKRGETDRANLIKFFPTLARQLATRVPGLAIHIKDVIDADSGIHGKAVREQFDKLILKPLSSIPQTSRNASSLVIVVDALDECEQDADVRLLINLFSSAQSKLHWLRIFVTSRPELPIRLGFSAIKGTYQDLILHMIPAPIIEHDIWTFLYLELGRIRDDFNMSAAEERRLPSDWPGEFILQRLVRTASPLFIFAATTCRFIDDRRCGDPETQLEEVLDQATHGSKLDMTYLPVLKQQLAGVPGYKRQEIIENFRSVVGTIVSLASPLSALALSRLLSIPLKRVSARLDMLHSVLSVPSTQESPVRLLHLSFRDYLVDHENREANELWVDEEETHRTLAKQCMRLMYNCLHEDICNLQTPGSRRSTIGSQKVKKCLPPELQYACLYWVYHRRAFNPRSDDNKEIYDFLRKHLLHWLEAMSLMGRATEILAILKSLEVWFKHGEDPRLSDFIADAVRFVTISFSVIDEAPLQICSSALVFAPTNSVIRKTFKSNVPRWISLWPHMEDHWDACLSILDDHSDLVMSVAFSHD